MGGSRFNPMHPANFEKYGSALLTSTLSHFFAEISQKKSSDMHFHVPLLRAFLLQETELVCSRMSSFLDREPTGGFVD